MPEREWLIPSIGLTLLVGGVSMSLIPQAAGLLQALWILPAWMAAATLMACLFGFAWMVRQRVEQPFAQISCYVAENRRKIVFVSLVMLLAGLNMIAFMWLKPLLNYLVPFWADPLLADLDHLLFFGTDPWLLLGWMDVPAAGLIYHPGWFMMMILALLMAAGAPASPEKSAVLMGYFLLWSVIGPAIHILLPATGPIFYEQMGYGPRFAGVGSGVETAAVADYLWSIYAGQSFGAGSGISAMPSMHVTISSWTVIAFLVFARRWLPFALSAWLVIFLLSIALGWHYALDGIAGLAAAIICHHMLVRFFRPRIAHVPQPQAAGAHGLSARI